MGILMQIKHFYCRNFGGLYSKYNKPLEIKTRGKYIVLKQYYHGKPNAAV